ncbi:ComEC/Rec2 family competence protein [Mesoplasma florum]|uniref:ComEC/Rec2 family competence protein n=1 Tax=Mesoplasma florum TaxID=2151 RepID=UPI0018F88091|nr:MBL fold metallo-hydrolase [Mesoplasma florum]
MFVITWIVIVIIMLLIYQYWNSNSFEEEQEIVGKAKILKCKTNYIIVKINKTKFYIQANKNNYVVGMKLNIKGKVNQINSISNYYEFDFKEYLSKDNIRYQIKASNLEILNNFNIRVLIYKHFNLNNAHLLINVLFLNKYDSSNLMVSELNQLGLKYLINFNFINMFLMFKLFNKITLRKFKYISTFILFVWSYLTCWPIMFTRIMFNQILDIFKTLKSDRYLKNLVSMVVIILIFPNFAFSSGFWYIVLIILFWSLVNKEKKFFNFFFFFMLLNLLNVYFTYQINGTSMFYAFLLSPIISVYYWITPLMYLINKDLLNNLYDVLLSVVILLKRISLILNVGYFNIIFILFGYLTIINFVCDLVSIKIKIYSIIAFTLFLLLNFLFKPSEYLTMLNVGNGNSFVYHNKWNNITIIFDAGVGKQRSPELVSNFLKYQGINKIDLIFISHTHEDHYNNLFSLKENFKLKQIILNEDILNTIKIKNIIINIFINPYANSENNKSLVLIVDIGNIRSVFMGDAEKETEMYLMNRIDFIYILNVKKVDILQIGHHGSKTSSSFEFINLIKPKIALISGENEGGNKKFPHKETIDTLKKLKIQYYITNGLDNVFVLFKSYKIIKK